MTVDQPQPDAADVLAALEGQLAAYRRVAQLAEEQSRHVSAGRTEELLVILEQRQAQMTLIAELEETIAPVKRSWPLAAETWSSAERAGVESLFAEAKALLAEITARDTQDMLALGGRRQVVGRQLREPETDGQAVRQITRRYAAAAYRGSGSERPELGQQRSAAAAPRH